MRLVTSSITGSGTIGPIVVDYIGGPMNGGLYVALTGSSTGSYTAYQTPDSPYSSWTSGYGTSAAWFIVNNTSGNVTSASANQYVLVNVPCQAVKVTVSASAGTTTTMYWLQGLAGNP